MASIEDKDGNKALVEQQQALSSYLDALFREMPVVEELGDSVSEPSPDHHPVAPPPPEKVVARPASPVDKEARPLAEPAPPVPQLVEQHLAKQIVAARETETPTVQAPPVAKPESADELEPVYQPTTDFQVLFFRLGKLNLAVPLEHLSGILRVGEETITKVPGYAEWHMGLMKNQNITVNVLDTAKLILPTHHQHVVEEQEPYRFYILLDGKRWGLACHAVADVVSLQPDEVKWRKVRKLQPWLAGTVIDKMCALLDVEGFLKMLHQNSRVNQRNRGKNSD